MSHKFERAIADIWIHEMQTLATREDLERYAKDRASKFALCAHVDELRQCYAERMNELKGE